MKNKIRSLRRRLSSDKLFFHHFLQIFLAMLLVFSLFTVYTYQNSRSIIETEFTNASVQDLESLAEYVDSYIMDTRYLISTLVTNETLQFFYASPSPESVWSDYARQVQSQLSALRYSREAIQGIYLYSEASHTIYSSSVHTYAYTFEDRFWLEQLNPDDSGFSIFPYAMRNSFPFVICVAKEFTAGGNRCAIAVMIDLSKLSVLSSIDENSHQEAFLVSDSQEIIYRYHQDDMPEPLSAVEYLIHYKPDTAESASITTADTNAYSYMQLHSAAYPWSYVLVTHLQDYTHQLSTQNALLFAAASGLIIFAILFAVFFALRSLKPIQNIRSLLDSPELLSSGSIGDNEDIKYIASRIAQYVQTNQGLRKELQERLSLLNETQILALQSQINPHFLSNTLNLMYIQATDALGYDHSLPLMILNTSSLIRYAIEPAKMVTLETELAQTDIYLSILDQRYDKNLTIVHDIAPDALNAMVPRLFLQPIIENAVFHGFSDRHEGERSILTICCTRQTEEASGEDFLTVRIQDNGTGISPEKLAELKQSLNQEALTAGKSIGLRNVVRRMNLIYSDRFSLSIESTLKVGTCFTLRFPYVE